MIYAEIRTVFKVHRTFFTWYFVNTDKQMQRVKSKSEIWLYRLEILELQSQHIWRTQGRGRLFFISLPVCKILMTMFLTLISQAYGFCHLSLWSQWRNNPDVWKLKGEQEVNSLLKFQMHKSLVGEKNFCIRFLLHHLFANCHHQFSKK